MINKEDLQGFKEMKNELGEPSIDLEENPTPEGLEQREVSVTIHKDLSRKIMDDQHDQNLEISAYEDDDNLLNTDPEKELLEKLGISDKTDARPSG